MARRFRYVQISLLALVLLVATPALAQEQEEAPPVGITGAWTMTVQSDQGDMDMNVTFKQEGNEITGMLESEMGAIEIAGEMGEENAVSFWASIEAPDGSGYFDLFFSGVVEENKTITGMLDAGGMMTANFVCKRKEIK